MPDDIRPQNLVLCWQHSKIDHPTSPADEVRLNSEAGRVETPEDDAGALRLSIVVPTQDRKLNVLLDQRYLAALPLVNEIHLTTWTVEALPDAL